MLEQALQGRHQRDLLQPVLQGLVLLERLVQPLEQVSRVRQRDPLPLVLPALGSQAFPPLEPAWPGRRMDRSRPVLRESLERPVRLQELELPERRRDRLRPE